MLAVIFNVEMVRSQNCLASLASMGSSGDGCRTDSGVWFFSLPWPGREGLEVHSGGTFSIAHSCLDPLLRWLMKG